MSFAAYSIHHPTQDHNNMSASLANARVWMTEYIMSIFLVIGVLGNAINIFMFTRKGSFRNSCSLYLLAASVINIFSVSWGIAPSLYTLYNIDPATYSYIYCKLRLYTIHTILMMGRSLIVFACIDRYTLCARSVRFRSFSQPKIAIRIIIAHIFVWPLLTIHVVFLEEFIGNKCSMPGVNNLIYGLYSTIVAGTLPPLLMTIFSILAIRHRRELRTRLNGTGINNRRDNRFMVMLFSEVFVYIITTCLYPTNTLYEAITNGQVKSTERQQIESFISFLAGSFLIYLNPALTFYVYFIASKSFRKEVISRLWKRIIGRRGRVEPRITHHQTILHGNQDTLV